MLSVYRFCEDYSQSRQGVATARLAFTVRNTSLEEVQMAVTVEKGEMLSSL